MSGLWGLFGMACPDEQFMEFQKISRRGEDVWRIDLNYSVKNGIMGLHRIPAVNDEHADECEKIYKTDKLMMIFCGEIYNSAALEDEYDISNETKSSVECFVHLYNKFGFEDTLKKIDGDYAICLIDIPKKRLYIARDPYGIRPLYKVYSDTKKILAICSEVKGILKVASVLNDIKSLNHLKPGTYEEYIIDSNGSAHFIQTYTHFSINSDVTFFQKCSPFFHRFCELQDKLFALTGESCRKRLHMYLRVGCLLSGGLDSSILAKWLVRLSQEERLDYTIQTFAVGMASSPDLKYARHVAEYIKSEHHEVIFKDEDIARCLDEVIYLLESHDVATIRASVGLFLLAKYIKNETNTRILFSGDGADEIFQGHLYFRNAPDVASANRESKRLLADIHMFSVLRTEKMMSAFGLEVRFPFLDLDLTKEVLLMDKSVQVGEKFILKSAFRDRFIPRCVLFRFKESISDGFTNKKRRIENVLQDIIDRRIRDEEFEIFCVRYTNCTPYTKEAYYYRKMFDYFFPSVDHIVPFHWMPMWNDYIPDPSPRYLDQYSLNKDKENSFNECKLTDDDETVCYLGGKMELLAADLLGQSY